MSTATGSAVHWFRRAADNGIVIPAAFLIVLLTIYGIRTPGALDPVQLKYTLLNASLALVLAATGLSLVVMAGGLDLSAAGVIAVVNAFLTVEYQGAIGEQALWLILAIVLSAGFGALNGVIVHRFDLEPVVVTWPADSSSPARRC